MMSFLKGFAAALVSSVVVNLIILYIARPFVIDPTSPLHALSVGPVVALTVIGIVGAAIVYAIMRALMKNPNTAFIWVAVIVLVLSFIPDFLIIGMTSGPFAGANVPSALTLMLMHVAAGVLVAWSFVTLWGARSAPELTTTSATAPAASPSGTAS